GRLGGRRSSARGVEAHSARRRDSRGHRRTAGARTGSLRPHLHPRHDGAPIPDPPRRPAVRFLASPCPHLEEADSMTLRIMTIYGTRPEAIKVAPIIKAIDDSPDLENIVVVTGQHREML